MKKTAVFLMALSLLLVWTLPVFAAERPQNEAALTWLRGYQQADGGFTNGYADGSDLGTTVEVVLAAAAAGADVSGWLSTDDGSPLDYLASQVKAGQASDANRLSKVILAAVATGQNPRDFGGKDLVAALLASQDAATGQFGDSLFAHAYAILALHSAGAVAPQNAVDLLTGQVTDDGAWALFGGKTPGTADTNTTALAIQALVATGELDVARGALPYFQRMQNADGGFPYQKPSQWGADTDANSTAVVLQALHALGEPLGAWAAGGTDPLGALLALWDAGSGGYFWQASAPYPNIMATAQAVQAAEGMDLVNLSVVGAARAPRATAIAPAAAIPLLPESGGFAAPGLVVLAGLALAGAGLVLRRR